MMKLTDDVKRNKTRKRIILYVGFVIYIFILYLVSPKPLPEEKPKEKTIKPDYYERIVSLAPSITEILYAMDCGDRVVGVTKFCRFPPEATLKPKVGGLLDTNYHAIHELRSDLVIYLSSDDKQKAQFDKMFLPALEVSAKSIDDVLDSIVQIGKIIKKEKEAEDIVKNISQGIERVKAKTKGLSRPTVMIVLWRTVGEGVVKEAYIAGQDKFHNQLIELAGGKNVFRAQTKQVINPLISAEMIMQMNPDFIIEIMPLDETTGFRPDEIIRDWSSLPELTAFKNNNIYVLNKSYMGIPGPRLPSALEDFARRLHPEIDWD